MFPAYAGMIRRLDANNVVTVRVPRLRGDEPLVLCVILPCL